MAEQISAYNRDIANLTKTKDQYAETLKSNQETLSKLEKQKADLEKAEETINALRKKKDNEKDDKKKDELTKQIRTAETKRDEMPGGRDRPEVRQYQIDAANNAIKETRAHLERVSKALEGKQADKKAFESKKDIVDWLKRLYFTIDPIRPDTSFGK